MSNKKLFAPFQTSYEIKVIEKPSRGRSKTLQTYMCHTFGSAELIANGEIMKLMEKFSITNDKLNPYSKKNIQGVSIFVEHEDLTNTFYYIEIHRI